MALDMNKTLTRIFTVALLMMVSMGAKAKINVEIGEFKGGTIVEKSQTDPDDKGLVTVTITVTPDKGYTISQKDIVVVSTFSPSGSSGTRAPEIAAELILLGTDPKDLSEPRDYTFIVASTLGAWVKEANFKSDGSKGPNRSLTKITSLSDITDADGSYYYDADIDASGFSSSIASFTGTLTAQAKADGTFPVISNLGVPIFITATDAIISNVIIESVGISQAGITGSIACTANGATRIYNCGILSGEVESTGGATDNPKSANSCGGLVGVLDETARVINCYSYANITGGNRVGGIVGYNNGTTTAGSINTMVMNCMFYGDITAGNKVSPIYGGNIITNLKHSSDRALDGLNTFNYYAYDKLKTKSIDFYNCALAMEEKYLNRFEIYRLLLNSNKKLAAYYASTSTTTVNPSDMAKWVLETADRTISSPKPYPILKAQGYYPSIINIDAVHSPRNASVGHNKGCQLGKLSVTISAPSGWTNAPTNAKLLDANGDEISTSRTITLTRTDKDEDRFNFNYDKVQLPYYNDYGTKNYTSNKVVTGWKITDITTIAGDPYTLDNYDYSKTYSANPEYFDYPNYNFADRKSSQKDLYSVSGRVFSQGAYFDVPYGVTSITIEPYWGKAAYVADEYKDVVYSTADNYAKQAVTQLGRNYGSNGTSVNINYDSQKVYTSISNALSNLSGVTSPTVYDYAVVLVGNLHQNGAPSNDTKPFTMMSVDLDNDHEPDCSLIYHHNSRAALSPIRFDFLNIPGTAQAQKPNGATTILNAAIFRTKGWFEITNTAFIFFNQYEYENTGTSDKPTEVTKASAPLILLGGYIDQFVSAQSAPILGKTIYIHVGSNVLINSFGLGTHSDGSQATPHVPVSVTGGDYNGFYLTGTYNANAEISDDNAECYISGGHFVELAGAAQEQIGSTNSTSNGNIRWQIYDADITNFYGGGVNDAKPVKGNITTDIFNSHVTSFCGGPKFGNMASEKVVITTAEGCTFGKFFGAGYGGNSYSRKKYFDNNSGVNWGTTLQNYYISDKGKYFDGNTTNSRDGGTGNNQYGKKGPGVATDFDYEFLIWTSGKTGGRFFVKFVSFSLAQCNNVESTLKKCIISDNFYGGGSLGTVTGTATSTLEDCTVAGNVFGAGYSATLPKIKVRNGGFTTVPSFNSNTGMFIPGEPSMPTADDERGITEYQWKHKDIYPANNSVGFINDNNEYDENGKYVVTTVDISKTNLGSVGSVILTLQGDTTVGGNVYGGGDASSVNGTGTLGNTIVTLKGNTQVTGDVFGGGNEGIVSGGTTVNIGEQ